VYTAHNTYCTVWVDHVVGTAELAKFLIYKAKEITGCCIYKERKTTEHPNHPEGNETWKTNEELVGPDSGAGMDQYNPNRVDYYYYYYYYYADK